MKAREREGGALHFVTAFGPGLLLALSFFPFVQGLQLFASQGVWLGRGSKGATLRGFSSPSLARRQNAGWLLLGLGVVLYGLVLCSPPLPYLPPRMKTPPLYPRPSLQHASTSSQSSRSYQLCYICTTTHAYIDQCLTLLLLLAAFLPPSRLKTRRAVAGG